MKRLIVILAGVFFVAIVAIVLLADEGRLPRFVVALYAFPNGDKVGHFLLMGGMSFLLNLALQARTARSASVDGTAPAAVRPLAASRVHWLATLALAALVTLEEASQAFFNTRSSSWGDLLSSLGGIACLGLAGWFLRRKIEGAQAQFTDRSNL